MTAVDVMVFVEHVARELDAATAVKYWLWRDHRLVSEVRPLSRQLDTTVAELRPHVVALPWLRFVDSSPVLKRILPAWPDAVYIDLCYEQLLSRFNFDFRTPGRDIVEMGAHHQVWSRTYGDFLTTHGIDERFQHENAPPFLTLYDPPYSLTLPTRAELAKAHSLDIAKKWLFFPENYGWAFKKDPELREFYVKNGADFDFLVSKRTRVREYLEEAVTWLAASSVNDVEIIFRPRPAVPTGVWLEIFQRLLGGVPQGFKIIKQGSVREWVTASDATMTSYSTTLFDARYAGKPAVMLLSDPIPDWLHCDWFGQFPRLVSSEAVAEFMVSDWSNNTETLRDGGTSSDFFASGDSFRRLAGVLAKLREKTPEPTCFVPLPRPSVLSRTTRYFLETGARAKRSVVGERDPDDAEVLHDTAESDRFGPSAVRQAMSTWTSLLNDDNIGTGPGGKTTAETAAPLFTIAICTFNRADMLRGAIESVFQDCVTAGKFEVLVVDNNSTDGTCDLVEDMAGRDPRLRYVFEPTQGLSNARNTAIREARGEYVAFIDDECRVPFHWLEVAEEIAERCAPEAFGGPYNAVFETLPPIWMKPEYFSSPRHSPGRRELTSGEYLPGGNMFWQKDVIESLGGFDSRFGVSGKTISVGEETHAQNELRRRHASASIVYDPALAVGHLVRDEKTRWRWVLRHRYKSGLASSRIFYASGASAPAKAVIDAFVRLGYITWLVIIAVYIRDRTKLPRFGNFVFERVMPQVVALGHAVGVATRTHGDN